MKWRASYLDYCFRASGSGTFRVAKAFIEAAESSRSQPRNFKTNGHRV